MHWHSVTLRSLRVGVGGQRRGLGFNENPKVCWLPNSLLTKVNSKAEDAVSDTHCHHRFAKTHRRDDI